MTLHKARIVPALGIFLAASMMSGCGSDSTAPGGVDSNTALQSLALGLQSMGGTGSPTTPDALFGGIGPLLDQVNVTIDGASLTMFALGLRETFPTGTCDEALFTSLVPPPPGQCTPPALGTAVILWQAVAWLFSRDRSRTCLASIQGDLITNRISVLCGRYRRYGTSLPRNSQALRVCSCARSSSVKI